MSLFKKKFNKPLLSILNTIALSASCSVHADTVDEICTKTGEIAESMYKFHLHGGTKSEYLRKTDFYNVKGKMVQVWKEEKLNQAFDNVVNDMLNEAFIMPKVNDVFERIKTTKNFGLKKKQQCKAEINAAAYKIAKKQSISSQAGVRSISSPSKSPLGNYSYFVFCNNGTEGSVIVGDDNLVSWKNHDTNSAWKHDYDLTVKEAAIRVCP